MRHKICKNPDTDQAEWTQAVLPEWGPEPGLTVQMVEGCLGF